MDRRHDAITAALALIAICLAPLPARAQAEGAPFTLDAEERAVLRLINAYRASHGLHPLVPLAVLNAVAHDHSLDMATRGYFAHATPDGRSPFDRMRDAGYDADSMGENLAAGNEHASETFEQWRRSPSHNRAMLDPEYVAIGIGRVRVRGSRYEYYWTTDFGSDLRTAWSPSQAPSAEEGHESSVPERIDGQIRELSRSANHALPLPFAAPTRMHFTARARAQRPPRHRTRTRRLNPRVLVIDCPHAERDTD